MTLVAAQQKIRWRVGRIIRPRQPILPRVQLAGNAVRADLVRLEYGPGRIVLALGNRVRHVVMALCASHRHPEEALESVLHRVFQPLLPGEHLVVPHQEPRRTQCTRIFWRDLIRRDHLRQHAVVGLVLVQGFHDPIAPSPDVRLRIPHLVAIRPPRPVAVTPDVHPVPPPTLPMPRIHQQPLHQTFIGTRSIVFQKRPALGRRGIQSHQIHEDSAQKHFPGGFRSGLQPARRTVLFEEYIHWILSNVPMRRNRRPPHRLKGTPGMNFRCR